MRSLEHEAEEWTLEEGAAGRYDLELWLELTSAAVNEELVAVF